MLEAHTRSLLTELHILACRMAGVTGRRGPVLNHKEERLKEKNSELRRWKDICKRLAQRSADTQAMEVGRVYS